MSPLAAMVFLALAFPLELFDEYSLLPTAPLTERVTARARYRREGDGTALLPRCLQGPQRPSVRVFGSAQALQPRWTRDGWTVLLPSVPSVPLVPSDSVRVLGWVERPVDPPRLFRAEWPRVREESIPTRRVAIAPRALLGGVPRAWTCPSEAPDEVPCVTRERAPPPLLHTLSPPPSPRGTVGLALALVSLAFAAVSWSERGRIERSLGAAGGAAIALAVALSMVGACAKSWGPALALTLPWGVLVGAFAVRSSAGRSAGGIGLMVVPLLAVTGRSVDVVVGAALVTAMVALGARALTREG